MAADVSTQRPGDKVARTHLLYRIQAARQVAASKCQSFLGIVRASSAVLRSAAAASAEDGDGGTGLRGVCVFSHLVKRIGKTWYGLSIAPCRR